MGIAERLKGIKLSLVLNHRCNLRCSYCYTGEKFDRAMPGPVARRAVEWGLDRAGEGFFLLAYFGGEPLLEWDAIREATAHARAEAARRGTSLYLSLATNGTLVTEEIASFLRANEFSVHVSLDGDRIAHDAARRFADGTSSHQSAAQGVRRLIAAGLRPRVIAVVDPANVEYLPDSFEYVASLGTPDLTFAFNYSADWNEQACERLEAALRLLGERYLGALRQGRDVCLDPIDGKIASHVEREHRSVERCGFGLNEFAVAPSGRIYPCDRLVGEDRDDAVCLGDLERGLDDQRHRGLLAERKEIDPECQACELRPRCSHTCGCVNYETTRDLSRPPAVLCWIERRLIAESDRLGRILFEERAPLFLRRFYAAEVRPD